MCSVFVILLQNERCFWTTLNPNVWSRPRRRRGHRQWSWSRSWTRTRRKNRGSLIFGGSKHSHPVFYPLIHWNAYLWCVCHYQALFFCPEGCSFGFAKVFCSHKVIGSKFCRNRGTISRDHWWFVREASEWMVWMTCCWTTLCPKMGVLPLLMVALVDLVTLSYVLIPEVFWYECADFVFLRKRKANKGLFAGIVHHFMTISSHITSRRVTLRLDTLAPRCLMLLVCLFVFLFVCLFACLVVCLFVCFV